MNASYDAVGTVLEQFIQKDWQTFAFFSHKLSSPETHYSTFGRELLAIYIAIKHFRLLSWKATLSTYSRITVPWLSPIPEIATHIRRERSDIRLSSRGFQTTSVSRGRKMLQEILFPAWLQRQVLTV